MAWEFSNDRPIYSQMSEQLVAMILRGDYKMGDKLPGVRELATVAAVNPNTVQRALSELENLGLSVTKRNVGRFVSNNEEVIDMVRSERAQELIEAFFNGMISLGYTEKEIMELINNYQKKEDCNE